MDRWPYPFIEMHPDDMASLSVAEGELLRTVCARLHCPLPPILSSTS